MHPIRLALLLKKVMFCRLTGESQRKAVCWVTILKFPIISKAHMFKVMSNILTNPGDVS